jgi:hypothetical protein
MKPTGRESSAGMDVQSGSVHNGDRSLLLALPAEIRVAILEFVFQYNTITDGLIKAKESRYTMLDDSYNASEHLHPLLACRQLYQDGVFLGFSSTTFIISSLFGNIPQRLSLLHAEQIETIRNISFVADARQFRTLIDWKRHPFRWPSLQLDKLTIVLHRSSFWHYLFDYTSDVTKLLRNLHGVKRLVIVRNGARVKGSFKTWYNRLIGYMMKQDHKKRYDRQPPKPEKVWWKWSFDDEAQVICLEARPPKPMVDEESYLQSMLPLMEELKASVESEEWNPDPRSRYMYY